MMKRESVTAYRKRDCVGARRPLHQLMSASLVLLSVGGLSVPPLTPQLALAQPSTPLPPCLNQAQIEELEQNAPPLPERNFITAHTISQEKLSPFSLWWAEEQFDEFGGKLVTNWVAYEGDKEVEGDERVDLIVNLQPWTLLDYLGRYRFVNKFGTVARDYGYDVRICSQQAEDLATYTCNYNRTLPDCDLQIFSSFGRDSLPVPRRALESN